jgi:hypothetical protein
MYKPRTKAPISTIDGIVLSTQSSDL